MDTPTPRFWHISPGRSTEHETIEATECHSGQKGAAKALKQLSPFGITVAQNILPEPLLCYKHAPLWSWALGHCKITPTHPGCGQKGWALNSGPATSSHKSLGQASQDGPVSST